MSTIYDPTLLSIEGTLATDPTAGFRVVLHNPLDTHSPYLTICYHTTWIRAWECARLGKCSRGYHDQHTQKGGGGGYVPPPQPYADGMP